MQHRVAGILTLSQANNWPVKINLKVRGVPEESVTPFATAAPTPRFHYSLTDRGCTYRLEIETGAKRHKDARALRRFDVTLTTYNAASVLGASPSK